MNEISGHNPYLTTVQAGNLKVCLKGLVQLIWLTQAYVVDRDISQDFYQGEWKGKRRK